MPRTRKTKFYAVGIGREGPKVYKTWEEVRMNCTHRVFVQRLTIDTISSARPMQVLFYIVKDILSLFQVSRYPGAVHKSFTSLSQAEEWLAQFPPAPGRLHSTYLPHVSCLVASEWIAQKKNLAEAVPTMQDSSKKVTNAEASPLALSSEQNKVLQLVKTHKNVFFTGSAGALIMKAV